MSEPLDTYRYTLSLAHVLRGRASRASALSLAERLLAQFNGVRRMLEAEPAELRRVHGLQTQQLEVLKALPMLAHCYYSEALAVGETIHSPKDTEAFLTARLRHLHHEVFCCLFLDNRHRVLCFEEMFRGTIDGTSVYPREVVKEALRVNAAAVIVAHNHPSGVAEPSDADERITGRLKAALGLVDIRLLDHLVVGQGCVTSLASRGLV